MARRPAASARVPSAPQVRPRARREWNEYLTDNQHALSKEEVLRRKMLHVSKNNVLSEGYTPLPLSLKSKQKGGKARRARTHPPTSVEEELTSLDLLDLSMTEKDDAVSSLAKVNRQSERVKTLQRLGVGGKQVRSSTGLLTATKRSPFMACVEKPMPIAAEEQDVDEDLALMKVEIGHLHQELRSYEDITGRASLFMSDAELQALCSPSDGSVLSQTKLMRFLVQLVCQTLTHLLQKEVEHTELRAQLDLASQQSAPRPEPSTPTRSAVLPDLAVMDTPANIFSRPSHADDRSLAADMQRSYGSDDMRALFEQQRQRDESLERMESIISQSRLIGSHLSPAALRAVSSAHMPSERIYLDEVTDHVFSLAATEEKGLAEQAGDELNDFLASRRDAPPAGHPSDRSPSRHSMEFSGTSATDFLFFSPPTAPTSTPPTAVRGAAEYVEGAADRANNTFDLYVQSFNQSKRHVEEPCTRSAGLSDSYEDMIDRLSSKFSSSLHHGARSPTAEKSRLPAPAQAPHPYPNVKAFFQTTKELFPATDRTDPRVRDATLGSY